MNMIISNDTVKSLRLCATSTNLQTKHHASTPGAYLSLSSQIPLSLRLMN